MRTERIRAKQAWLPGRIGQRNTGDFGMPLWFKSSRIHCFFTFASSSNASPFPWSWQMCRRLSSFATSEALNTRTAVAYHLTVLSILYVYYIASIQSYCLIASVDIVQIYSTITDMCHMNAAAALYRGELADSRSSPGMRVILYVRTLGDRNGG